MATTEMGKELRKLRIERDERMQHMAQRLGISTSFLSAIETGRKDPPAGFEDKVIAIYRLSDAQAQTVSRAADRSRDAFTVNAKSAGARDTAAMFARQIDKISENDLLAIQEILKNKDRLK